MPAPPTWGRCCCNAIGRGLFSKSHMEGFAAWRLDQGAWLDDHCLYMVIKGLQGGKALVDVVPVPWRNTSPTPWPISAAQRLTPWIKRHSCNGNWIASGATLLRLAKRKGVTVIGDMPFYVAHDSSDVWGHSHLFSVHEDGSLREQSGVPPDYFSTTGQLWGTPTFAWHRHEQEDFRWWRERIRRQLRLAHVLRIDHFRALESYWAVSGQAQDARGGRWRPSPGATMLRQWREAFQRSTPHCRGSGGDHPSRGDPAGRFPPARHENPPICV